MAGKIRKILLINSPFQEQEYIKFSEKWDTIEDEYLGVGIVHKILHDSGCEVIFKNTLHPETLLHIIEDFKPEAILFSVMQSSAQLTLSCVKMLRECGFYGEIMLGGWFAKLSWKTVFEEKWPVDAVCFSAAETTLPFWLSGEENIKGLATKEDWKKHSADEIEIGVSPQYTEPMRIPKRKTYAIETSRGCPHAACAFCSLTCLARKATRWKAFPLENVYKQLVELNQKYNCNSFSFVDDDILGPLHTAEARAIELTSMLKSLPFPVTYNCSISVKCALNEKILSLLKDSGLRQLGIGFESVDEAQLRRYNKAQSVEDNFIAARNISNLRINLIPGLITFDPYSTPETVHKNLLFLFDHLNHFEIGKLTKRLHLIPGTPIVNKIKRDNLLVGNNLKPDYIFLYPEMLEIYKNFQIYTEMLKNILGHEYAQGKKFYKMIKFHKSVIADILNFNFDTERTKGLLYEYK